MALFNTIGTVRHGSIIRLLRYLDSGHSNSNDAQFKGEIYRDNTTKIVAKWFFLQLVTDLFDDADTVT